MLQCLLVASLLPLSSSLQIDSCGEALGMESGAIPDASLSASSSFDSESVGPSSARIRTDKNGGAWCPERQISAETYEYLEINLGSPHIVSGVETQGRWGGGAGKEYPTQYVLEYYRPGAPDWIPYKNRRGDKLLTGNTDTNTGVLRRLYPPILASRLRILPFSVYPRTMCVRAELYGCPDEEALIAYSGPEGFRGPVGLDLRDDRYDGFSEDGWLEGGLGQLSDGELGQDVKDLPLSPPPSSQAEMLMGTGKPSTLVPAFPWLGWNNESNGPWLELSFRFHSPRNFSTLKLHVEQRQGVGAPREAQVAFSMAGQVYTPHTSIHLPTMEKGVGWLEVGLGGGVGKFLKLRLKFSDTWLLISEITFQSALVKDKNLTRVMEKKEEQSANEALAVEREDDALGTEESSSSSNGGREGGGERDEEDEERRKKASESPTFGVEMLALGVSGGFLLLCICLGGILCLACRQRHRRRKLFGSSPAYSGLKAAASNGTGSSSLSSSNAGPHITLLHDANGTLRRPAPPDFQNTLRQAADGRLYVAGGEEEKRPLPSLPSWNGFHFPPPPPPEALHQNNTDSSEYAEPTELRTHSTATLPLLGSPSIGGEQQSSRASSRKPAPPPRTTLSSPGSPYAKSRSPRLHLPSPQPFPTESDSRESLHYASSHIPGCRRSLQGGAIVPACPLSPSLPPQIPRASLRLESKLGEGEGGQVHLATLIRAPSDYELEESQSLVALKLLRPSATAAAKADFERELGVLGKLRHPNLVQLLGAVTEEEPWGLVVEYERHGDLASFLRQRDLSSPAQMFIAAQISSACAYLASLNFVHRDLAARNCLVGQGLRIKVGDFGMTQEAFAADYYLVEGKYVLPIRWMSWEAILLGHFSPASDAWAFAVTLWEILTRAATQPLPHLKDEEVVELARELSVQAQPPPLLPQPSSCPSEVFDLMRECWQRDAAQRPTFKEIHLFLQRKTLAFHPDSSDLC